VFPDETDDEEFDEVGLIALSLSDKLRELAVRNLLVFDASDAFCHDLLRSGLAREAYLIRCRDEDRLDDYYRCSGRYGPILDVVAASDFAIARRITALSPKVWREGSEPLGDFWYAQVIHCLVQESIDPQDMATLLEMAGDWSEPQLVRRRALFESLASPDQERFEKAFEQLIEELCKDVGEYEPWDQAAFAALHEEKEADEWELESMLARAVTQVSIEGLALLRLAERRGLTTQVAYPYCPESARVPMREPFPGR
jgi:hypothetical protein